MLCAFNKRISANHMTGYHDFRVSPAQHLKICRLIRDSYTRWLANPDAALYGQTQPGVSSEEPGGDEIFDPNTPLAPVD